MRTRRNTGFNINVFGIIFTDGCSHLSLLIKSLSGNYSNFQALPNAEHELNADTLRGKNSLILYVSQG